MEKTIGGSGRTVRSTLASIMTIGVTTALTMVGLTFIAVSPAAASGSGLIQINGSSFNNPAAISSDGTNVWVANAMGGTYGTGSVSEIDISTGGVTEVDDPSFDNPEAVSSDGNNVWVANATGGTYGAGSVSEIDVVTGTVTSINDPSFFYPDAISSDGTNVWVANY